MKILLFGEYSNVHHTLCEALRRAGHEVLLISDGDGWKDYPRDIDLRRCLGGPVGSLLYLTKLLFLLPKLRGFDVVQLINPIFLDVKSRWNRWMISYLKRKNQLLSLGCFGDDYFVVSRMRDPGFMEYTDFHYHGKVIDHPLNRERISRWCNEERQAITHYAVSTSTVLLAGLYEYYKVYDIEPFRRKLHYMPFPIEPLLCDNSQGELRGQLVNHQKVRVLLATQKKRAQMKGTDLIEPLLRRLAKEHPAEIEVRSIESVPFVQYQKEVEAADVVVDQLYSYTPGMGALEAMRQGKVVITGYEPEFAQFLSQYDTECAEETNCDSGYASEIIPGIINLRPFEDEENYRILEEMLLDRQKIAQLSADSQAYVERYHNADKVAEICVRIWQQAQSCSASSSKCPSQR